MRIVVSKVQSEIKWNASNAINVHSLLVNYYKSILSSQTFPGTASLVITRHSTCNAINYLIEKPVNFLVICGIVRKFLVVGMSKNILVCGIMLYRIMQYLMY